MAVLDTHILYGLLLIALIHKAAALTPGQTCTPVTSIAPTPLGGADGPTSCTGHLLYDGVRACGYMDNRAAEVVCFETGDSVDANGNKIATCEVHHEDETDDHTALDPYLRLDIHNARSGKQCPKGGTQECFHDCYFDPVDAGTVVQPNGALGADVCASTKDIGIECWDIDECLWGAFRNCSGPYNSNCKHGPACGPNTVCTNLVPLFSCDCKPGYEPGDAADPYIGCVDLDECIATPTICGDNSQCENIPGSYICLCDPGYDWDSIDGVCKEKECPAPPVLVPNGFLTTPSPPDDVAYDDTATFTCNEGFVSSYDLGPTYDLKCRQDGEWCGCNTPICQARKCPPVVIDPNAYMGIFGPREFGISALYACATGYTPAAPTVFTRNCLEDGVWSSEDYCTDIDECKDNLCPANSQCYNTLGSYSCICDPGYTGDGVTGSPCVAIECGNIPTIENADRITSLPPLTTTADYNDVLDYRCRDGYESSARRDARERVDIITLVCRADGIWEPNPLPTCVPVSCGDPGFMNFGIRQGKKFLFEYEVTYTCLKGYQPNDHVGYALSTPRTITVTCEDDRKWTKGPYCKDVNECEELDYPCGNDYKHYCVNTPGSYRCMCSPGFREDETGNCVGYSPEKYHPDELQPCDLYSTLNLCPYGACVIDDNGRPYCQCNKGHYGVFCDDNRDRETLDNSTVILILGISSLAVCGFILIIVTCVFLWLCLRTGRVRPDPNHHVDHIYSNNHSHVHHAHSVWPSPWK